MSQPAVSRELVEHLEKHWPDRCPAPDAKEREIWMAVGANAVVQNLKALHVRQSQNVIESP